MSAAQPTDEQQKVVEKKQSISEFSSVLGNTKSSGIEEGTSQGDSEENRGYSGYYERLRPFILVGLALLILGWWISSIVLPETRHRWFVFQTSNLAISLCLTSTHFWCAALGSCRRSGLGPLSCEWTKNIFCCRSW